jgi:SAM-dependent methyltransferase
MTSISAAPRAAIVPTPALFAVTVFASAALVFLVEPMVAKLILPLLGGSPSVWNTSLAFFQIALLAGYGYAHLLQRLKTVRTQAIVHVAALVLAGLALPLRISAALGAPSSNHPILWLLAELTVSLGGPFAVLSATAPLVQAWHARVARPDEDRREPYTLYAASNLGSLLALLAYPLVVEPLLTLQSQRLGWSLGYGAFVLLIASLALAVVRAPQQAAAVVAAPAGPLRWTERLRWVALAAIPSSLMLGVTTHITTDIASAPFLWVLPLALYLLTFVIAFQTKPLIPPRVTLVAQAAALAACVAILPFSALHIGLQFGVHIAAFFFTALMCHQALVARRPEPARLTEFYLWMSVGGVVGGGFNAFLAPVIFDNVWEYPLVLALSCFARPWGRQDVEPQAWVMLGVGVVCALASAVISTFRAHVPGQEVFGDLNIFQLLMVALMMAAVIAAFMVRTRSLMFFAVIAVLSFAADTASDRATTTQSWRSFFGVLRQSQANVPPLGGTVRMLAHGTTLHGAQALSPQWRCRPLVYYTPLTPIGQVFAALGKERGDLRIGAVGLGTGSVAAYVRPGDHLTFFEIDPLVIRVSTDPRHFSYTTQCAKGQVDYVLGDARLTLAGQPKNAFDILLIDAFSSDAVPTHLLTVEAVRGYLTHLKPDGVLILHLSNRNLDLKGPAQAVAHAAGGVALLQQRRVQAGQGMFWEADEDAVIVGRSEAALVRFRSDLRWTPTNPFKVRPWTDDYVNLPGALWRRLKERAEGKL